MTSRKALIGALSVVALLLLSTAANARGRTSVMLDSKMDNAAFLMKVKGPITLGARFKIKDASPIPILRYDVTSVKGIRVFVQAEADKLGLGGGKGGKKGGKGGGLGGIDIGFGGEYFFRGNLSVVALFGVGPSLNVAYYF